MIVVWGSINLDLICAVTSLPAAGQTLLTRTAAIEPGGKGANQAMAAARDGARVVFAGAVGQDALADQALAGLRDAGIDLARIRLAETHTGIALITVDDAGRNHVVVAAGANLHARADQLEEELLTAGTTLLLQMESDPAETAEVIGRGRAAGCRILLSLAPAGALPPEALRAIDLLLVNEDEAAWLATHIGTGNNAASLAQALGVQVIRTLGSQGCEAAGPQGTFRIPAHDIEVVDTTGAGDCFAGVLAAGLDRGLALEPAARRATAAAGLCCTRRGTQGSLPIAAEIDDAGSP